jgi:hypothetical protein
MNLFSLKKEMQDSPTNPTSFYLFSDRLKKFFPDYRLDAHSALRPKVDTPTMNFNTLKEILLSKDLSRNIELEFAGKEQYRFLDSKVDLTS